MSGYLALVLALAGTIFLLRRDARVQPELTAAIWIPLTWITVTGSRLPSEWFGGYVSYGTATFESGNVLDRNLFTALLIAGLWVLVSRRARIGEVVRSNRWLTLYFVYAFIAITWSDYPLVASRRWVKAIGEPIMVLVLLTEARPTEAISAVWRRCAFILIPLSLVFIRYFPALGRMFSDFDGMALNIGVTLNKNSLGYLCAATGLFLFGHLLKTYWLPKSPTRRMELLVTGGMFALTCWVLWDAKSSTSLAALLVGSFTVVLVRSPIVNKRFVGAYVLGGITVLAVAAVFFDLFSVIVNMLGRESTLTGRTELWPLLLSMDFNPIFGTGYESFWLGQRLLYVWDIYGIKLQEAHNGYLEVYLHLGLVGLFLLIGMLFVAFRRACAELMGDLDWGCLRLGILFAIVVFNWTEAGFRPLHLFGFAFYCILVAYPSRSAAGLRASASAVTSTQSTSGRRYVRQAWNGKAARTRATPARLPNPKGAFATTHQRGSDTP